MVSITPYPGSNSSTENDLIYSMLVMQGVDVNGIEQRYQDTTLDLLYTLLQTLANNQNSGGGGGGASASYTKQLAGTSVNIPSIEHGVPNASVVTIIHNTTGEVVEADITILNNNITIAANTALNNYKAVIK